MAEKTVDAISELGNLNLPEPKDASATETTVGVGDHLYSSGKARDAEIEEIFQKYTTTQNKKVPKKKKEKQRFNKKKLLLSVSSSPNSSRFSMASGWLTGRGMGTTTAAGSTTDEPFSYYFFDQVHETPNSEGSQFYPQENQDV